MRSNLRTARLIAWAAFVLGVVASVAANVAHARPEIGPRLASAFAPVALLLTVEIMSRVPWPAGGWWRLGRFAGTGTVALVAAVMSYRHMYGLLLSYGEDDLNAAIGPLAVDGLMVVASLALLALAQHTLRVAGPTSAEPVANAIDTASELSAPSDAVGDGQDEAGTVRDLVPPIPADVLSAAQRAADQHRRDTGRLITRDALRSQLRVSNATAGDLLRLLKDTVPAVPASPNGRPAGPERR